MKFVKGTEFNKINANIGRKNQDIETNINSILKTYISITDIVEKSTQILIKMSKSKNMTECLTLLRELDKESSFDDEFSHMFNQTIVKKLISPQYIEDEIHENVGSLDKSIHESIKNNNHEKMNSQSKLNNSKDGIQNSQVNKSQLDDKNRSVADQSNISNKNEKNNQDVSHNSKQQSQIKDNNSGILGGKNQSNISQSSNKPNNEPKVGDDFL